jgi:hypothetical protein
MLSRNVVRNYSYSLRILDPLRWDRRVPKRRQGITSTRCVISRKSPDIICLAAEAGCHDSTLLYSPSGILQVVCISVFFVAVCWALKRLSRTSRLCCSGRGWSTAVMIAFLLLAQWPFCRPANISGHPHNLSLSTFTLQLLSKRRYKIL